MAGNYYKEFSKGLIRENPVFVLLLGLCPTLGVTTSGINGMAMGLATAFVLLFSNIIISLIKKLIPSKVRIPAYILVIATLVTLVEMIMQAYLPDIYAVLGLFIPLIVVNCVILGRAEGFASRNGVVLSIMDALGHGLGFTLALTILGSIREILGGGSIFGIDLTGGVISPMMIFILPPGAFITLGFIIAYMNKAKDRKKVS